MNNFIFKNGRSLLNVSAAAGVVATIITTVHATHKSTKQLVKEKDKLTKQEIVKKVWKNYIPVVLTGLGTIGCIIGSEHMSKKTQTSLMGAYTLLYEKFRAYQNTNEKLNGKDIHEKIVKEKSKKTRLSKNEVLDEQTLRKPEVVYEDITESNFQISMRKQINAQCMVNKRLGAKGYVTVNDYLKYMNAEAIREGDRIGWDKALLKRHGFRYLEFINQKVVGDDGVEYHTSRPVIEPTYLS